MLRAAFAQVRDRESEEQRRERRVQPERVGIFEHAPDERPRSRARDPQDIEHEARPDEDRPLEATSAA